MTATKKLTLIIVGTLTLAIGYVGFTFAQQARDIDSRNASAEDRASEFVNDRLAMADQEDDEPERLNLADGDILAINRIPGDDYSRVVERNEDGSRTFLNQVRCERFHAAGDKGLCLWKAAEFLHKTTLYDFSEDTDTEVLTWGAQLPSRARLSADGLYGSSTMFTSGVSYQDPNGFGTLVEMLRTDDVENRKFLGAFDHSESDSEFFDDVAARYWGVTWGLDGEFYATWGNEEDVRVIKGSYEDEIIETTEFVGTCPSLSPDGKTLVYKEEIDDVFRLVSVDLESGNTTLLSETRGVDDQVEWLNNEEIAYGLHLEGFDPAAENLQVEYDLWKLNLTDGSEPELYLPQANSPVAYQTS